MHDNPYMRPTQHITEPTADTTSTDATKGRTPDIRARARALRKDMTAAERLLWARLRRKQVDGAKFRRQHPIGLFIVDFYCPEVGLAVEVDGLHHDDEDCSVSDRSRDKELERQGIHILRFWNEEVLKDIEGVVEKVRAAVVRGRS
jgi:very-short-patch-repair endonuclease